MKYNGRTRQSIASARDGIHSTLHGDVRITHLPDGRTFCRAVQGNGAKLIDAGATGVGHPGERQFLTLAERRAAAMDAFAPRPFPQR